MLFLNEKITFKYSKKCDAGEDEVKVDSLLVPEGDSLVRVNRYAEAIKVYDQAINLCPNHIFARLRRADVYVNLKEIDSARADYEYLLQAFDVLNVHEDGFLNKIRHDIYVRMGLVFLYICSDFHKAIEHFNQALIYLPNNDSVLACRGQAYFNIQQHENAFKDYDRALKINPANHHVLRNEKVLYLLGQNYYKKNELISAKTFFDKCLVINSEHIGALQYRAKIFLEYLGNYNAALSDVTRVLELSPDTLFSLKCRYQARIKLGRFEEALEDIGRCLKLEPKEIEHKIQRIWMLYELHRYDLASDELTKLRMSHPKTVSFLNMERLITNREKPLITVENEEGKYQKGGRRNSLLMIGEHAMVPIANQTLGGCSAYTRIFYEESDQQKQPQKVVKSLTLHNPHPIILENECHVWNLFYPDAPAMYFYFDPEDCRLVLPFFSGKTLNKAHEISLFERLQIWLTVALELERFHRVCERTHGDLKEDNIMIERQSLYGFSPFDIRLIDFGLSEEFGKLKPLYYIKNKHIAPEMCGPNGSVTISAAQDVYSFAKNMLMNNRKWSPELRAYLEQGCVANASERPSLCEIIDRLWVELLNFLPEENNYIENIWLKVRDLYLASFVKNLNITGARILLKIIDEYDEPLKQRIQQSPVVVEAILFRYKKDRDEFQDMSQYILTLFNEHLEQKQRAFCRSLNSNSIFAQGTIDGGSTACERAVTSSSPGA